nr:hypothetical protein [Tanacetum cinerariifolium]
MFETASKRSSDPPLSTGHTVRSREDRMEQETDLTDCVPPTPMIYLSLEVTHLEVLRKRKARNSQPMKRRLFKGRVETFTNKSLGEDASKQERNDDQTEELNLTDGADIEVIVENKGTGEKGSSTAHQVSTARPESWIEHKRKDKKQATIAALTEKYDEIQDRIDFDHEIDVRLTHEEQEMYTIEETATLLAKYFERRKKQLAAKRAEAIRNKPPTRIQIDDFVPINSEKEEKKSVEPEAKSDDEESTDYEQENEELRMWLTVVLDEEETVDLEILSTNMLRKFDKQDLVDLHILVMKRFEDNTPEEKRYPLIKEMLEKMLNWKLKVEAETEEIKAREAAMNFEPLNESEDEQEVARECMFQDFLKCKPYNFSGTEGVDSALTWWNSHNRTIGVDAAYAIKWAGLMKLMTEGYAAKSAENKRRMKSNPRDNHGLQPPFKRQNVSGQNVARVYTARNNERISTKAFPGRSLNEAAKEYRVFKDLIF